MTIATTPHTIQSKNDIEGALGANCSRNPIIIRFGGVPIGVITPPIEQA